MSATAVLERPAPGRRPSPAAARTASRYFPGLDGIRAVAVIGVMLYHFDAPYSSGGFLGVDLFFVLSGYLITGQLITRWVFGPAVTGVSFRRFWTARARRLFPALGTMLAVVTAVVTVADRVQLGLFRGDLAAAATYTSNWWYVFHQRSYFEAAGRPPLLQHLWSLAVEEQFYLLWPVVIWVIVRLARRRLTRETALFATAVGLMVLSAAVMGVGSTLTHVPQLGDPSRWYFGTDSHSMGLLAGAALAALRHGDGLGAAAGVQARRASAGATALGFAALAGVLVAFVRVGEYSTVLYRVGFLGFSLIAAVLVWAAVQQGPLARLLGRTPLAAVGRRSYTLYLWHWPVAAMTRPGVDLHWPGWTVFALRVALTAALTEATYRWVERPVRRLGWVRYWQRIGDWRRGPLRGAYLPLLAMAVVAALCWPSHEVARHQPAYAVGVTYVRCPLGADGQPHPPADAGPGTRCANAALTAPTAPASPTAPSVSPPPTSSATSAAASRSASRRASASAPAPRTRPASTPAASTPAATSPPAAAVTRPASGTPARPAAAAGRPPLARQRLFVYGDSVPLGAIAQLAGIFASVTNHAVEGIQAWDLLPQMIRDGKAGRLDGAVVLLHTGDNGLINSGQLRDALRAAAGARRVIVATPHVPRSWQGTDVRVIEQAVPQFRNAVLFDWNRDIRGHADWVYSDAIHLTPAGREAYSQLVARAARG